MLNICRWSKALDEKHIADISARGDFRDHPLGCRCILFSPLLPEAWRPFAAGSYALLTLAAFVFLSRRDRAALGALAVFGILVVLFLRIPASNSRDRQPDVANAPFATIEGDLVTIHNV